MPAIEWFQIAREDLLDIVDYIFDDDPRAALRLAGEIETKTDRLALHPQLGRPGRMDGTRELVVHPNYIVVYRHDGNLVSVLRVLHAAQQWPPSEQ